MREDNQSMIKIDTIRVFNVPPLYCIELQFPGLKQEIGEEVNKVGTDCKVQLDKGAFAAKSRKK